MSNLSEINNFGKPVVEPKVPKLFIVTDPYNTFDPFLFKAYDEKEVLQQLVKYPYMIDRYLSDLGDADEEARLERLDEELFVTPAKPVDLTGGGTDS